MNHTALLALEDGSIFSGAAIGAEGSSTGEVVFNTAMTGYQEILTESTPRAMVMGAHRNGGKAACVLFQLASSRSST